MRKWLTSFILVTAMLAGAIGVGAHEGEGNCPISNMPDCCKKSQSANNTPEASMARLCCNLNCSEPGSSGSNASFSPQRGVAPSVMLMPHAVSFNGIALTDYRQSPHKLDSNPKYIQHLALLI